MQDQENGNSDLNMEIERSGFTYIPQKEENKSWDQFVQTEFSSGSASEKHTDFIKKVTQNKSFFLLHYLYLETTK